MLTYHSYRTNNNTTMKTHNYKLHVSLITGDTSPIMPFTQVAQARRAVDTHNVTFEAQSRVWIVKGTTGTPRVVTLFPKATCSCPSANNCYHTMAVKMTLGIEDVSQKHNVSLTQLRRNTRSRKDKKSGRKKPRVADADSEYPIRMYVHMYIRTYMSTRYPLSPYTFSDRNGCITTDKQHGQQNK